MSESAKELFTKKLKALKYKYSDHFIRIKAKITKLEQDLNEDEENNGTHDKCKHILDELSRYFETISGLMQEDMDVFEGEASSLFEIDRNDTEDMIDLFSNIRSGENNNCDDNHNQSTQNDDEMSVHSLATTVAFPDDTNLNESNQSVPKVKNTNPKKRKSQNMEKEEKEEDEYQLPPSKKRKIAHDESSSDEHEEEECIFLNMSCPPKQDKHLKIRVKRNRKFGTIKGRLFKRFRMKISFFIDNEAITDDMTPQQLIDEYKFEEDGIINTKYEYLYQINESILCYHGPCLYKVKVLNRMINKETQQPLYFVHYYGWRKEWDEWVSDERCLSNTTENITKMKRINSQVLINTKTQNKNGSSSNHSNQ